jgi:hypothetical protein
VNLVQTSTRLLAATALAGATVTGVMIRSHPAAVPAAAEPAPALQTVALTSDGFVTARFGGASMPGTRPFALLGATWDDPGTRLASTVEVRTRAEADGRWTGWRPLDQDEPSGPGRGSTDPVWVGDSDGVQARIIGGAGRPLPAGLRLDLINPDSTSPDSTSADSPAPAFHPVAEQQVLTDDLPVLQPRPMPSLITRAGWGADETIVKGAPEYTSDVQVLFVHHTADNNAYSCADSARMVRSIEAYHVRSRGWDDIGYNFLVDKCGQLFEGRRGGESRPVLGAHTLGFNSHSAAIAVIGNYTGVGVSPVVKNVIAQVAAYKLGMYGNLASSRTMLLSSGSDRYAKGSLASLNRISGHRDTGKTECPGDTLYAQLPSIRAIAAAGPADFALTSIDGTTQVGDTYYTRGPITPLWTTSTPSALMWRFDVLVDGVPVVSAPRSNRTAQLDLPAGQHTLTIRAVHLSGRTASRTVTVVSDPAAPAFTTAPVVRVRPGSLTRSVPVRLQWAAADRGGLRSVTLTSPVKRTMGTIIHNWDGSAGAGHPTTFTVRATDRAGNARTASTTRTPVVLSESTAARTGRWGTLRSPAFLGATAMVSRTAGSSLSWTFTGSSVALAASRTAAAGRIKVYLDGSYAGILDLRTARTLNRQALWGRAWSASARHTVKFVVEGTAGRPSAVLDGLVYLR